MVGMLHFSGVFSVVLEDGPIRVHFHRLYSLGENVPMNGCPHQGACYVMNASSGRIHHAWKGSGRSGLIAFSNGELFKNTDSCRNPGKQTRISCLNYCQSARPACEFRSIDQTGHDSEFTCGIDTLQEIPSKTSVTENKKNSASLMSGEGLSVWSSIRKTAIQHVDSEPMLASYLHATILNHDQFSDAVSFHLAGKLQSQTLSGMQFREIMETSMISDPGITESIQADILAVRERDPAVDCCLVPLLYLKGVHALAAYRIAHWLWKDGRTLLAVHLQNRISEIFGVDIHPAARVGRGILMDHGTSVVIGETAVVGDDVSMLHEVTLGGTGKSSGDRHPKVRHGVLIGAGAKILGNVEIGEGAKIGAGSVVLTDVPPHSTFAGVPAEAVGRPATDQPALYMNHGIDI